MPGNGRLRPSVPDRIGRRVAPLAGKAGCSRPSLVARTWRGPSPTARDLAGKIETKSARKSRRTLRRLRRPRDDRRPHRQRLQPNQQPKSGLRRLLHRPPLRRSPRPSTTRLLQHAHRHRLSNPIVRTSKMLRRCRHLGLAYLFKTPHVRLTNDLPNPLVIRRLLQVW